MSMYQKPVLGDKSLQPLGISAVRIRKVCSSVAWPNRRRMLLLLPGLLFCLLLTGVCFAALPASAGETSRNSARVEDAAWSALMERLEADGFDRSRLHALFGRLDAGYSAGPMGHKMRAMFKRKFAPSKPKTTATKGKPKPSIYPGVLVESNLRRARLFLNENKGCLVRMERRFGVPKEVAVGLMLVETRLGSFLGKEQAFYNLACLAASDSLESIRPEIKDLKLTGNRVPWLRKRLAAKSSWAYTELKALIVYSEQNDLDPIAMPGSIYGAVGLCQFMPSNILRFGVDGDADGKVNLFHVQDAIHSLANYLKYHGWKPGIPRKSQCRVLRHYNNSSTYANTILAVADALR